MAFLLSSIFKYIKLIFNCSLRDVKIKKELVFITGCDSGIGFYFAKHLASLGCVVFAGVMDLESDGAKELNQLSVLGEINLIQIDVTVNSSIQNCLIKIEKVIATRELELMAVINNAGVMVFGEFNWLTEEHILKQINVNLIGYMKISKAFFPLLHKFKGRLVNISSHCSMLPLPCLSVYSATKCAIEAWSSSLALELYKYHIPVITILPGGYPQQSNIFRNHPKHKDEMWNEMTQSQRGIHQVYFDPVMTAVANIHQPSPINDPALLSIIRSALLSKKPKRTYVNSPLRYYVYHKLIALAGPLWALRRLLILSFLSLPNYK